MITSSLVNLPALPEKSIQTDSISINDCYSTPPTSIHTNKISSESDSTLTDDTSTGETDYEDFVCIPKPKHVHFDTPSSSSSKGQVRLKLENDEAEFFAHVPSVDSPIRKRDRIRSAFRRKFPRTKDNSSDTSSTEWNEILANTLVSMQDDVQDIINGFDQIEQTSPPPPDDSVSNISGTLLKKPILSFCERQREKLGMMRIAQMLYPPNLLTYDAKESSYPYTDIIEPKNFNFLRLNKGIPDENLLVQHKPIRYRRCRHRTQHCLLRMKRDLKKIKHDLYGEKSSKCQKEASSLGVLNYQLRLQKTLLEVRKQIAEYDRMHVSMNDHRPSISQIIANANSERKTHIEEYRMKSRPMESAPPNCKNQLISAPYIPRRVPAPSVPSKKNDLIDIRFDPITFVDLTKEAEKFFGNDIPFWYKPYKARLSIALPLERKQSTHFIFPSKTHIWDRFIIAFKTKQKLLKYERQSSDDEFASPVVHRRRSSSVTSVEF